ncbi:hypothetical protein PV11_07615 [Exophiala sideris]|uniref:Crotonobetaine/carnitine-CoA ligase n=1 Tax=Exophiala sideris TaxID=1016849 RepID=A0A0D1YZA5_9EURO|nr:hypothetical protein PV11_07615 [Exophiala sideris]
MGDRSVLEEYPATGIVKIILNRPTALNALNADLLEELVMALKRNRNAKVIVLEGAGDRSFCAGQDLKQGLTKHGSSAELRKAFHKLQDVARLTSCSPAIVIAAVQGFAVGGGAEIALGADFVIGGPATTFRFPEVPIGHAATGGITQRLVAMVGLLNAKRLLLTGAYVGAQEAFNIGLLTELTEDPKQRALELAEQLARLPTTSLASSKQSLEKAVFPNVEQVLLDEIETASICFAQIEASNAFTEFATRRKAPGAMKFSSVPSFNDGKKSTSDGIGASSQPGKEPILDLNRALDIAVAKYRDRPLVRFPGYVVSYGDFGTSVSRLAGGLRFVGVRPGDRVLVMMRNSVQMLETWMSTCRLGAIWVPINPELRSSTLHHAVSAVRPTVLIVDEEIYAEVKSALPEQIQLYINGNGFGQLLSALQNLGQPVMKGVLVEPRTTAAFLLTSGSTGRSKPCILSHQYFLVAAQGLIDGLDLKEDDVLYCPFPLYHLDATALTLMPAILLGATAALSTRFSASNFWHEIRDAKATVYDFMGATLALVFKQKASCHDRQHRVRIAWGVPMPSFAKEYERRFGHCLVTLYGSTESGLPIIQQGNLVTGSCGRPREGFHARITDADGRTLPAQEPGQLLLKSDIPNALFSGYFDDPEKTTAALYQGWLKTGDVAKMDNHGNVFFLGRMKDIIRRRGENINATEVEEEFLHHPDVVIAAAFAVPSELGQGTEDDLKVAIQLRESSSANEGELWTWSVENMARFQVPDVIEIVSEMPKTSTGKVEKSGLKRAGGRRFRRSSSTSGSRSLRL